VASCVGALRTGLPIQIRRGAEIDRSGWIAFARLRACGAADAHHSDSATTAEKPLCVMPIAFHPQLSAYQQGRELMVLGARPRRSTRSECNHIDIAYVDRAIAMCARSCMASLLAEKYGKLSMFK